MKTSSLHRTENLVESYISGYSYVGTKSSKLYEALEEGDELRRA